MLPVLPTLTEKQFMASVFKLAEMFGWRWYHTVDSRRSAAGFPDAVLVRRPRVLFVEFKSARGTLTDDQVRWLDDLRASGQETYVWRPRDVEWLERILR
jgi:hypothetical protein